MDRLTGLTGSNENRRNVEADNRDLVCRRFLLILYIRTFIFRIYLESAKASGGIKDEHKGRWLLLQVSPWFLQTGDVFSRQFWKLKGADSDTLEFLLEIEAKSIEKLLGGAPIFCVLDEARVPANSYKGCFRSRQDLGIERPIHSQIIEDWLAYCPNLIVSGTGLSMQEINTVLGSANGKLPGLPPILVTDVGAFDTGESQRAYLSRYLPPGFLASKLASRIEYWLGGRYLIAPRLDR